MKSIRNLRKGQALTEYALILGAVVLMAAAAVSVFGHKTSDLWAAVAAVLPGAHDDDNAPIRSGKLIDTTTADGAIEIDIAAVAGGTNGLSNNAGLQTLGTSMVVEAPGTGTAN